VNQGLLSVTYHVEMELMVKTDEPKPAIKGTATETISLMTSIRFINRL
jgi:hypothetical protein